MSVSYDRFYTWIDVESRFRALLENDGWPNWLQATSAYAGSIDISVSKGASGKVVPWLKEKFGPRINEVDEVTEILLDGAGGRSLLIVIEEIDEAVALQLKLLFDPSSKVSRLKEMQVDPLGDESSAIPLYAFHSFKGGVGRTTSALALALELRNKEVGRKILLVDADMEAPGVSFLLENRVPNFPVSFSDFLALANEGIGTDQNIAIGTVVDGLSAMQFDGLFVLPAFRSGELFESVSIRPEHLIRNSKDPFVISGLLRQLGKALGVDAIVVDLRAGISEVSAGLVLDPTVDRVLVTTLSGQSIQGTKSILSKISKSLAMVFRASNGSIQGRDVTLVFSQVREEQRDSVLKSGMDEIFSVLDGAAEVPRVSIVEFIGDLALMSRGWDSCLAQIERSGIGSALRSIADAVFAKDISEARPASMSMDGARTALTEYSEKLEFAESGAGEDFLVTRSLKHLAADHLVELPLVSVVGQKGAGKSYTYLQLVKHMDWSTFANKVAGRLDAVRAPIFPLLEPLNLSSAARALTDQAKSVVCEALGTEALGQAQVRDLIRDAFVHATHEGKLRDSWLSAMAASLGLDPSQGIDGILKALQQAKIPRLVFVVDGLEDLLQEVHSSEGEQRVLRSLLNEVSSWLSQIPGRPIGLVVFVRRDMVLAAIKQNPGQFFHKYQPYELRWNREEALRLVAWVTQQSGALMLSGVEAGAEEKLAEDLVPLWGLKLGSSDSREARTADWVLAALSDFKGQVQARDIVRFLRVSSASSIDDAHWSDRVLVPTAIRKAPVDCGREKIGEIEQENPRLKDVFVKLRALDSQLREIPFSASEIGLSIDDVDVLERNGIVLREPDGYYMPEMYRQGLDFTVPKGARPRILALARRVGISVSRYD